MSYWGKILGGVAGLAMGGPVGALLGTVLGHAADEGVVGGMAGRLGAAVPFDAARIAAMLGRRDQLFAIGVTVLAAKLAKCDGPVVRAEISAFRQAFRIPDQNVNEIGRMFDGARSNAAGYEGYAAQLGAAFGDNRVILEQVLGALFHIARADGPVNSAEAAFLAKVAGAFGLNEESARRARDGLQPGASMEDAYGVLGIERQASDEAVKARWKALMRENHPDSLASKGVPPAFIEAASDRVAKINAAYDQIKRERKL